jgi:hypothetical protein
MNNSHLANMRWLAIPSDNLGHDWFTKQQELDQVLESYGLDLSEEAVYLLYSDTPSDILDGKGRCLVARSVIGPKKEVEAPLTLIDWKALPVWTEVIKGKTIEDLLVEAQSVRMKAGNGQVALQKSFTLSVRRELLPELNLKIEAIFHE